MKEKTQIPYYLGIDAGSSSVGWAVTDTMYHVLKTNVAQRIKSIKN